MRHIKNDVGSFYSSEDVIPSLLRLCNLISGYPDILKPVRGADKEAKRICSNHGLTLYPTVRDTTLLYDKEDGRFIKILHPITIKDRLRFLLMNRAEEIFKLSEKLRDQGVKVVEVVAYGILRSYRRPVYIMKRVEGKSLYDILIREKRTVEFTLFERVIDEVARLHKLGYWFGDSHISHIFLNGSTLEGFIDIDGIRRNRFLNIKKMARDIAGLNYPSIPITDDEKMLLLNHYISRLDIEKEKFLKLLKSYIKKRWG